MKTALSLALFAIVSTLCNASVVGSPTALDVCQKPANVTQSAHSGEDLCREAICVKLGKATLSNAGSQICQEKGLEQGVFHCTHQSVKVDKMTKALVQYGKGTCAMPAQSTSVAVYRCENGASVNVFTKKDGTASFYVSRHSSEAPGAAHFRSTSKGRKDKCSPQDVTGQTDVVNDMLEIDCDGYKTICPVEQQ